MDRPPHYEFSLFSPVKCLEYTVNKIITFNLEKKAPLILYRTYNILGFVLFTLLYSGGVQKRLMETVISHYKIH